MGFVIRGLFTGTSLPARSCGSRARRACAPGKVLGEARMALRARCSIRGDSDVGLRKVIALEEQGFTLDLRQGIAEAVAVVEAR